MTDREMLELAAKAADLKIRDWAEMRPGEEWWAQLDAEDAPPHCVIWNPFLDDGDALRLAVKLDIFNTRARGYQWPIFSLFESHGSDPYAATRRAIVRAAAEIGKQIK